MKNGIKTLVIGMVTLSACIAMSGQAHADDWKHTYLRSAENISIAVDYQTSVQQSWPLDREVTANPIWINVRGNLNPNDQVRVIFKNISDSYDGGVDEKVVDLHYENGKFTGSLNSAIVSRYHCNSPIYDENGHPLYCNRYTDIFRSFKQELAIVINGHWLVDPMNNSHNFQFKLNQ